MEKYVEYLGLPTTVGIVIIGAFLVMQLIGEFLEFKGKVVPEVLKVRKIFTRRKEEKALADQKAEEMAKTLQAVQELLNNVNAHYSEDNITKRDAWMRWVNDRAEVYDESIVDLKNTIADTTQALRDNTKMTEEMFVQSSRDRIIDFAAKVAHEEAMVSKEEFNRIFKVYDKYEKFLEEHELTNGEIDIAYRIIREAYDYRLRTGSFFEDLRGYN